MRRLFANRLAVATGVVVVLMSGLFALSRSLADAAAEPASRGGLGP